ncbi:MAG: tRNA epoxyqueuosine(34) reductase QueG [Acidobacteria bacterium]|nr:tRNA epoxyqueuosine(34) reductase QueG [Acidobacteriota bacterium]
METEIRAIILDAAHRAGFDLAGIAPVDLEGKHVEGWREWIDHGRHGEMRYMERSERADLRRLLPSVKSVICLGLNYYPAGSPEDSPVAGKEKPPGGISVYAQGRDYHLVMTERMEALLADMRASLPFPFEAKSYVDTGPILERAYAETAGLGWIGKNTCLINQQVGSWFFLGEILTSLEIPPDTPPLDRCGTCTACLDACPTGAFVAPYQLDARLCISYLTIELRGSIPEPMREQIDQHVFGCDICQDVCPWNRRAAASTVAEFLPLPIFTDESEGLLQKLARLGPEEFRGHFASSPIKRSKHQGFLRNVAVALGNLGGNSGDTDSLPVLNSLRSNADPVIAEHAEWAIQKIERRAQADVD